MKLKIITFAFWIITIIWGYLLFLSDLSFSDKLRDFLAGRDNMFGIVFLVFYWLIPFSLALGFTFAYINSKTKYSDNASNKTLVFMLAVLAILVAVMYRFRSF